MAERRPGKQRRIEAAFIFDVAGAGHQHMVVASRHSISELAAGQRDLHAAVGALGPRRRDRRGACRRAAGLGQSGAALPGADGDVIAIDDMRERDVGALGEDRMVFEQRPEAVEFIGLDVVDPEDRVRIAHADHRRRMQHRRVDRADLQLDHSGCRGTPRPAEYPASQTSACPCRPRSSPSACPASNSAGRPRSRR